MLTPRYGHAAVSFEKCIYVFGGENTLKKLNSVEKYNPAINKWLKVSNMSIARSNLAACIMNGKIYFAGCFDAS